MNFKGMIKRIKWSQVRNNLVILLTYTALGFLLGWSKFLFIQLFTVFLFAVIAFWFFYIQHQHESAYNQWKENWNFVIAAILLPRSQLIFEEISSPSGDSIRL